MSYTEEYVLQNETLTVTLRAGAATIEVVDRRSGQSQRQEAIGNDIYLPDSDEPVPAVLMRTPYNNNMDALIEKGRRLANAGYACVIQDCRGR